MHCVYCNRNSNSNSNNNDYHHHHHRSLWWLQYYHNVFLHVWCEIWWFWWHSWSGHRQERPGSGVSALRSSSGQTLFVRTLRMFWWLAPGSWGELAAACGKFDAFHVTRCYQENDDKSIGISGKWSTSSKFERYVCGKRPLEAIRCFEDWHLGGSNVVSWLVARFAIVPKIIQLILNPCIVWKVHYCGKKCWEGNFFCPKKCLCKKN